MSGLTRWERRAVDLVLREGAPYCWYCGIHLVMPPAVLTATRRQLVGEAPVGYHLTLVREVRVPHIDHVVPRSAGGSDDLDNLVLACAPCNLAKSSLSARRFLHRLLEAVG